MFGCGPRQNKDRPSDMIHSIEDEDEHEEKLVSPDQPHMQDFYRDETLNPHKVDGLLKDEIMQMSAQDRNAISEEIHGVRCLAPTETPEFLETSLLELDAELARIPPAEKRAFCHASAQNHHPHLHPHHPHHPQQQPHKKHYVDTDEFRLRFLRCELFNVPKAARRLVNYLDLIAYCMPFDKGLVVLQRPITLSDFNEAEQSMLRKGHLQLLPFRDRSGRRVLTGVASLGIRFDPRMWYKILLYFLWIAGDDVETQQKGIVMLLWPNPDIAKSLKLRYPINSGGRLVQMVFQCVPVRVAAFHFCTPANDPFFRILKGVFALALVGGKRSRLKFHTGGPLELKYQINSYGIPVDLLPLTSTGNVKTTYLKQWIRLRTIFEEDILANGFENYRATAASAAAASPSTPLSSTATGTTLHSPKKSKHNNNNATTTTSSAASNVLIECPGSTDVVFRPGKPVMNHPGNVTFRSLIESKSFAHDVATQTQKSTIAREVVDEMIESRGGRFLVWDEHSCCWKAITDPNQQRHKVAIAFRNFKSYKKALGNRQPATSGDHDAASAVSVAFEKLDTKSPMGGNSGHSSNTSDDEDTKKRKRECIQGLGKACF